MTKLTEEELVDSKELREKMMDRLEVLAKVKSLILLPNTEIMNTKTLAEYYEVGEEAIKTIYSRNRKELEDNGANTLRGTELRQLKTEVQDATLLGRANAVTIFSIRAVLNVGMLLRDSRVAREIRNQLLNGFEKLATEQKVEEISREDRLLLAIGKATTPTEQMIAAGELNNYHNRHKAELNVRIDEMKPKEEAFDTFIDADGFQRMNDVAKSVGYGRNKLFKFLREQRVLMKDNVPYESFLTREWFVVRQNTITNGSFSKNNVQTFATSKGVNGISKMLKKHGLID